MNRLLVAVFDNESQANEASQVLHEMHKRGSITVYGDAEIAEDTTGNVRVIRAPDQSPLGTAVGVMTQTLVQRLGGATQVGASPEMEPHEDGTLARIGIDQDFIEEVAQRMQPGKVAIIAEVEEDETLPIEASMETWAQKSLRRERSERLHAKIEQDVQTLKANLERVQDEYYRLQNQSDQASETARTKLKQQIDDADAKLKAHMERTRTELIATEIEADAKMRALLEQFSLRQAENKRNREKRVAELRTQFKERNEAMRSRIDRDRIVLKANLDRIQDSFNRLQQKSEQAKEAARAEIRQQIDEGNAELRAYAEEELSEMRALEAEIDAEIQDLSEEIDRDLTSVEQDFARRQAALQREFQHRRAKLNEAWELTKQAGRTAVS